MTDPLFLHIAALQSDRLREAQRWRMRRRDRLRAAAAPHRVRLRPRHQPARAVR